MKKARKKTNENVETSKKKYSASNLFLNIEEKLSIGAYKVLCLRYFQFSASNSTDETIKSIMKYYKKMKEESPEQFDIEEIKLNEKINNTSDYETKQYYIFILTAMASICLAVYNTIKNYELIVILLSTIGAVWLLYIAVDYYAYVVNKAAKTFYKMCLDIYIKVKVGVVK